MNTQVDKEKSNLSSPPLSGGQGALYDRFIIVFGSIGRRVAFILY